MPTLPDNDFCVIACSKELALRLGAVPIKFKGKNPIPLPTTALLVLSGKPGSKGSWLWWPLDEKLDASLGVNC